MGNSFGKNFDPAFSPPGGTGPNFTDVPSSSQKTNDTDVPSSSQSTNGTVYFRDDSGFFFVLSSNDLLYPFSKHRFGSERVDKSTRIKTISIFPPAAAADSSTEPVSLTIKRESEPPVTISNIWIRVDSYDCEKYRKFRFVLGQPIDGPQAVLITDDMWQSLVRDNALMLASVLDQVGFPIPELQYCICASEEQMKQVIFASLTEKNTTLSPFRTSTTCDDSQTKEWRNRANHKNKTRLWWWNCVFLFRKVCFFFLS